MFKRFVLASILIVGFAGLASSDRSEKEASEYTFARVKFTMDPYARGARNDQGQLPWEHDYPKSEDFFLTMVAQVTGVHTNPQSYQVVELHSEDIFRYPFLYFSEPGFLEMTDGEVENLREYFNRGGFVMFDDFGDRYGRNGLQILQVQMKLVFPDLDMEQLELREPVFRSFYQMETLEMLPPYRLSSNEPTFWGLKNEAGRLMAVANVDNDFGEYWEDINNGNTILQPSVQSFQFGVNYLIYAMTH
jgi:hypothetical protein